jgi:hypothetical protein
MNKMKTTYTPLKWPLNGWFSYYSPVFQNDKPKPKPNAKQNQ